MLKRVDEASGEPAAPAHLQQGQAQQSHLQQGHHHTMLSEAIARHLRQRMKTLSLSRGGLADALTALGSAHGRSAQDLRAHGEAVADLLSANRASLDAAVDLAARRSGASPDDVRNRALELLGRHMQEFARRADTALRELHARMPLLPHASQSSMHEEIADVIRRRCGAGPYGRVQLRRHVRGVLADACGYRGRGVTSWYLGRMLAPLGHVRLRLGRKH